LFLSKFQEMFAIDCGSGRLVQLALAGRCDLRRGPGAVERAVDSVREHGRMLQTFVRRPFRTGTVIPSSRELAELMAEDMGLATADTVVELGAGTGPFTRLIAEHVKPDALVLAFEIDSVLAAQLQPSVPRVRVVNDSAEHLGDHLRAAGRDAADAILSGLPWANFSRDLQERLLRAVVLGLRPGGRFATFAYIPAAQLPPGRRFRALLESCFARVETTRVVYWNFPPAFVYRCTAQGGPGGVAAERPPEGPRSALQP
jgi:phosphatidylethanolamine/phosphatidyl-N-methylethanolamine N-methyltransferase